MQVSKYWIYFFSQYETVPYSWSSCFCSSCVTICRFQNTSSHLKNCSNGQWALPVAWVLFFGQQVQLCYNRVPNAVIDSSNNVETLLQQLCELFLILIVSFSFYSRMVQHVVSGADVSVPNLLILKIGIYQMTNSTDCSFFWNFILEFYHL
jgi:hypothetical protein